MFFKNQDLFQAPAIRIYVFCQSSGWQVMRTQEQKEENTGERQTHLQVATSETWRDKQTGEMREQTEWHRVVLFGKLAEVAGEYLRKGAQVYIEGQLRTRSWEDNGITRYVTEILVKTTGTPEFSPGAWCTHPRHEKHGLRAGAPHTRTETRF